MRWKAGRQTHFHILGISVIGLSVFAAVLGYKVFFPIIFVPVVTTEVPVVAVANEPDPALNEIVSEPAPIAAAVAPQPVAPSVPTAPPVYQAGSGVPVRIHIPSIALDAAVEQVTVTADGSLGVPKDPLDTGWFALGPRPGEVGSAVIDGHVNWWYGARGSFKRLNLVQPGDQVIVRDDIGTDVAFVVRESRTYAASAQPADVFTSSDGMAHLNLITCGGTWDADAKQYTERLVVFADRIMQ